MKKLIAALAASAVLAPGALAATSHFLKVSPAKTHPGKTITVSGLVGNSCPTGHKNDAALIYSKAFAGAAAAKTKYKGVPAVSVSLAKSTTGSFFKKVKLSTKVKSGSYYVRGRCDGGTFRRFGSTTLKVTKAGNPNPGGQFYS